MIATGRWLCKLLLFENSDWRRYGPPLQQKKDPAQEKSVKNNNTKNTWKARRAKEIHRRYQKKKFHRPDVEQKNYLLVRKIPLPESLPSSDSYQFLYRLEDHPIRTLQLSSLVQRRQNTFTSSNSSLHLPFSNIALCCWLILNVGITVMISDFCTFSNSICPRRVVDLYYPLKFLPLMLCICLSWEICLVHSQGTCFFIIMSLSFPISYIFDALLAVSPAISMPVLWSSWIVFCSYWARFLIFSRWFLSKLIKQGNSKQQPDVESIRFSSETRAETWPAERLKAYWQNSTISERN